MFNRKTKGPKEKGAAQRAPKDDPPAAPSDPVADPSSTTDVLDPDPAAGEGENGDEQPSKMLPFEFGVRYVSMVGPESDELLIRAMVSAGVAWWENCEGPLPEFAKRAVGETVVPMNDVAVELISAMIRAELPEELGFPAGSLVQDVGPSGAHLASALLHAEKIDEEGWEAYNAGAVKRFEQHTNRREMSRAVFDDIDHERALQDERWGGAETDDRHSNQDWREMRQRYEGKGRDATTRRDRRRALIQVAALVVAEIEAIDRLIRA